MAISITYRSTRFTSDWVNAILVSDGFQAIAPAARFLGRPTIAMGAPDLMDCNVMLLMGLCRLGEKLRGFKRNPAIFISGWPNSSTLGYEFRPSNKRYSALESMRTKGVGFAKSKSAISLGGNWYASVSCAWLTLAAPIKRATDNNKVDFFIG